jgi:hypothetical protein
MNNKPENPNLNSIIEKIIEHPIYDRFLQLLKQYNITKICDCHCHVSSGPNDMIKGAKSTLRPEYPFSVKDIQYVYDRLFASQGIETVSIVFDTPLPVYDMDQKNRKLLTDPDLDQRIIPFAVITPDMSDSQIESYLAMGAKGFKATPRTPSSQVKKKSINEISLFEMIHPAVLRLADENRLPFIVHLPQLVVSTRNREVIKDELEEIATKYPHITIILAHLGQAQTLYKVMDLLSWIEEKNLTNQVWMDISAVSVFTVFSIAFKRSVNLLYGTDNDFALAEQGRYVTYKMKNAKRVLAFDDTSDKAITALVSTHFGKQLRGFVHEQGIDLSMPMIVAQWEGILNAVEALEQTGTSGDEIRAILENLFFRNAEVLL